MIKVLLHKIAAAVRARRPAPPAALAEWWRLHLSRYTRDFIVWSMSAFVLTFFVILLLGKIFLAGSVMSAQAVLTGQRVLIHLASGEVEGNARHTQSAVGNSAAAGNGEAPIVSKEGLAPAPLETISMQTDKGLVPMVGKDGTLPWKYYARPYKGDLKRPLVAIVITDLGLNSLLTEDTLKLPHAFTLSFSPYASDARKWATKAREDGFETLVDLPMQTVDYLRTGADPGQYGLFADSTPNEISLRLKWVLSRFPGFVGVLAPENDDITANLFALRPMLTELTGHGVLFLYIKTPQNAALADSAKERQLFALGVDKVIDDDIASGPIEKQLDDLTALAKTQGYAIGFAHPYPPTLEAVSHWAESLGTQGVDLAPVSAIAHKVLP
jgi:polysaccharide deacetylase 2 family uncharacterized protein YibQ